MPFIFTGWQVDLVAKVGAATTLAAEMLPGVAWCSDVRRATVSFSSDRIGTALLNGEPVAIVKDPAPAGLAAATVGPSTRSRANASARITSRQPGKEGGAAAVPSAEQVLQTIATMLRVRHGALVGKRAGVNFRERGEDDTSRPRIPMSPATHQSPDKIVLYRFSDILQFLDVITITAEPRASAVIVTVQSQSASLLPGWAPLPLHLVAVVGWFIPFLHDSGANYDSVCKVRAALGVDAKDVAVVGSGGADFMVWLKADFGTVLKIWACVDQATKFFAAYIIAPTMLCTIVVLIHISPS